MTITVSTSQTVDSVTETKSATVVFDDHDKVDAGQSFSAIVKMLFDDLAYGDPAAKASRETGLRDK